jgi:hypothetical protein
VDWQDQPIWMDLSLTQTRAFNLLVAPLMKT